jgi:hypothetical protein
MSDEQNGPPVQTFIGAASAADRTAKALSGMIGRMCSSCQSFWCPLLYSQCSERFRDQTHPRWEPQRQGTPT